jgi:hypothetical protein
MPTVFSQHLLKPLPVPIQSLPVLLTTLALRSAVRHGATMTNSPIPLMDELRSIVMRAQNTWTETGLPRVAMVRAEACASQIYQPMLHVVKKVLTISDRVLNCGTATYFLVPVDIPATGEIYPSGHSSLT